MKTPSNPSSFKALYVHTTKRPLVRHGGGGTLFVTHAQRFRKGPFAFTTQVFPPTPLLLRQPLPLHLGRIYPFFLESFHKLDIAADKATDNTSPIDNPEVGQRLMDTVLPPDLSAASSSPVSKLPNELLLAIIEIDLQPYFGRQSYYSRLRQVSHIASRWRTIVDGTPFLWRWLVNKHNPEFVPECIEKSQGVPLIIDFIVKDDSHDCDRFIVPNLSRCKSLKLSFERPSSVERTKLSSELLSAEMPLLLDVELKGDTALDVTNHPALDIMSWRAPRLQQIRLRRYENIMLTKTPCHTLRYLHIIHPITILVAQETINLLQSMPNLEALTIHARPIVSTPEIPIRRVSLPSLMTVDIEVDQPFLHFFLVHVDSPNLSRVRLHQTPVYGDRWNGYGPVTIDAIGQHLLPRICSTMMSQSSPNFVVHMNVSGHIVIRIADLSGEAPVDLYLVPFGNRPALTWPLSWLHQALSLIRNKTIDVALSIQYFEYDWATAGTLELLAAIPNIRSLSISHGSYNKDLIDWLGRPFLTNAEGSEQWPLPYLRLLRVSTNGADSQTDLLQMAKARCKIHPFKLVLHSSSPVTVAPFREVMGDDQVSHIWDAFEEIPE